MGPKLMQACAEKCKDQCEFSLRITVLKLSLTDKEKNRGFEDIALTFTVDSTVIKIDNIQSPDENINVRKDLYYQTTPEHFARKLKGSPIMINLARECMDLGTVKLQISECFADAVLCDEFSSEQVISDYTFEKDGVENATMEISIQTFRKFIDNEAVKDFLRSNAKRRDRLRNKAKTVPQQFDSSLSSDDTISSFMCDADLMKDLCPQEDKTFHSFSTKSKASKCLSDIATSLNINKCSDVQKTFCRGCRGQSISGITCENKKLMTKNCARDLPNKNSEIYIRPLNRICSECFANLSILPKDAPCPSCSCIKNPQNQERVQKESKKLLKEILRGEKKTCKKGLQHQVDSKVKCKCTKKQKGKGQGKKSMFLRCNKVKRANEISIARNRSLRIKNPGVVLGHKDCQSDFPLVPKNQGWLWNVEIPGIAKIRRGWKPGAVPKPVARMMNHFLKKECEPPAEGSSIQSMNEDPIPTLKVEKKFGEYTITLNPLCDKSSGEGASPIVFKVCKSLNAMRRCDAKRFLKNRGVTKTCRCKNIYDCSCIDDSCRDRYLYEIRTISDVMNIYPPMKYEELNEISECSEIDFEFTPPFKMTNKCKRDVRVSVASTQYEEPALEKFEETEESSEHDIVVKKKKVKKVLKKKLCKKKTPTCPESRRKYSEMLREIKPNNCCVSYCRPKCEILQCEFGDRLNTNYTPLYQRCLQNYSVCAPLQSNHCEWNSRYNVMNC